MATEYACDLLAWTWVINLTLFALWFLCFSLAHDLLYRLHNRWFQISAERFDAIHYGGMMLYIIGIFIFNIAPYLALQFAV